MSHTTYYVDDPDAAATYPVTDTQGGVLDWIDPTVVTEDGIELAAEWLGAADSERDLKVPLDTLLVGSYFLRLIVPGDNDIPLGTVTIVNSSGGVYPAGDCSWPIDVGCLADEWDTLDAAVRDRAVGLASATLRRLTGYRVGVCPITVYPMLRSRRCWQVTWDGRGGLMPQNWNGVWINCSPCGETELCVVPLAGPVGRIDEVSINGVVQDETDYGIYNGTALIWLGDSECPWPETQALHDPTFSVTYLRGYPVDALGAYAAGVLANEFAKACSGAKCRFPATVTSITRQGVSFDVVSGAFPNGMTGIREVDAYIALWNPDGLRQQTGVWSPDLSRPAVIR
jgi:hypothetical protein